MTTLHLRHIQPRPGAPALITDVAVKDLKHYPEHSLITGVETYRFVHVEGYPEQGRSLPTETDHSDGRRGYFTTDWKTITDEEIPT